MSETLAIETRQLTRTFGSRVAVNALDLRVPRGCIFGFLGPNGAGKTTTIRLLLGLLTPTSGDVVLNGERFTRDRRDLLRHVGALVEAPSLYPHLTGEENLNVTRRLLDLPASRVHEVLDLFDLASDARRPVRAYSTGMRQLLGLALAWLGDPTLLVLDEPTSSLDPVATRKLRALLRRLTAERGVTIFLSSHVLSEVEQIVDWLGIIHKGRLLFQGELSSLKDANRGSLEDIFLQLVESNESANA
jgi:ABC-type multidrug transport system ATPase subunit